MELKGRLIDFRIRDVFEPPPAGLLMELHGDDVLQGRVLFVSDRGLEEETFVVVQVTGVSQPVVVPVQSILNSCE